ncbi:protein of unknown function (plasmid) [Azospirillum lipoferum 4B]|uniref:Uncharacterized protein n=1 Tax=Azospirillum lipoferum (strain 4B) TaxID=862719 RepID=G7ZGQ5_AZOL4|nr:protein of unknown function [Azospirillum lipoferum 4B]
MLNFFDFRWAGSRESLSCHPICIMSGYKKTRKEKKGKLKILRALLSWRKEGLQIYYRPSQRRIIFIVRSRAGPIFQTRLSISVQSI